MPEWITFATTVTLLVTFLGALYKFAYWKGEVDSDRKSFKTFMAEVRGKLDKILLRLPPAPVALNSPLGLTDLGKEIADDLNASEWASELAPSLRGEVKDMLPWEVDDSCDRFVESSLSDRMKKKVAASAYQYGLDRPSVRMVLRVVLREELLKPTAAS